MKRLLLVCPILLAPGCYSAVAHRYDVSWQWIVAVFVVFPILGWLYEQLTGNKK